MKKRENISSRAQRASLASQLQQEATPEKRTAGRPKGANDTTQMLHTRKSLMKEAKKFAIDQGITLSDYINRLIDEDLKEQGKL